MKGTNQIHMFYSFFLVDQLAVMSAFLGPDQAATEALLATDPDVSKWVQKYQRSRETVSQTDYEVSSMTAFMLLKVEWFFLLGPENHLAEGLLILITQWKKLSSFYSSESSPRCVQNLNPAFSA